MVVVHYIALVITFATGAYRGLGLKECPPWFEWVNTSASSGYCACTEEIPRSIQCDQRNQISWLAQGSCIFYDLKENATLATWCPFLFPNNATKNGQFPIHSKVSELNSVVCGNLSREVKGPLCGRCTNNTGPSIYFVGTKCVPCSSFNILHYLLLQYLPSTVIYLLVIMFRPNITSAPMANFVLVCNFTVFYLRFGTWLYAQLDVAAPNLAKTALTLCALWTIDAMLFISPPLCISQQMEEIYVPYLEFIAAVYPFMLLMLTYGLIQLHIKNFKPVVALWRLCRRCYVGFYRAWDPRSSMIQAFASLFFLSYAKLSSVIWQPFAWSSISSSNDYAATTVLYIDPNVPYGSNKHVLLMTFSVAVAVFVFLPPVLILVVYPTSLYRKISHWISPKWRLRIKTYVETFNGSFKDGTNGTRDYRSLSGLLLLLLSVFPPLFHRMISTIFPSSENLTNNFTTSSLMAIVICTVALLCILIHPYKDSLTNRLTAGLMVVSTLMFANLASIYDTRGSDAVKLIVLLLLLIPHCVLWSYIIWRFVKFTAIYCCQENGCIMGRIFNRYTEMTRNNNNC